MITAPQCLLLEVERHWLKDKFVDAENIFWVLIFVHLTAFKLYFLTTTKIDQTTHAQFFRRERKKEGKGRVNYGVTNQFNFQEGSPLSRLPWKWGASKNKKCSVLKLGESWDSCTSNFCGSGRQRGFWVSSWEVEHHPWSQCARIVLAGSEIGLHSHPPSMSRKLWSQVIMCFVEIRQKNWTNAVGSHAVGGTRQRLIFPTVSITICCDLSWWGFFSRFSVHGTERTRRKRHFQLSHRGLRLWQR